WAFSSSASERLPGPPSQERKRRSVAASRKAKPSWFTSLNVRHPDGERIVTNLLASRGSRRSSAPEPSTYVYRPGRIRGGLQATFGRSHERPFETISSAVNSPVMQAKNAIHNAGTSSAGTVHAG